MINNRLPSHQPGDGTNILVNVRIDVELDYVKGSALLGNSEFCSGFWEPAFAISCHHLFAFMTPQNVLKLTRTTQGIRTLARIPAGGISLFCVNCRQAQVLAL